ncbi:MAG: hypothetical protein U5K38_00500 [Woeseiaceae bacterium]|nr:hypothetical protein [Woeseiaceae bacterium]
MSAPGKIKDGPGEGAALLLIDVQQGLKEVSWGQRNNPDVNADTALLRAEPLPRDVVEASQ